MQYLKKIVVLPLIILLLSNYVCIAQATDNSNNTVQQNGINYIQFLSSIGVVKNVTDDVSADTMVTRAEFAGMVVRMLGNDGASSSPESSIPYTDVPTSHAEYANILYATKIGLVGGVTATEFNPEAPISYAQAIKMLVRALGYEIKAQSSGGYPIGYMTVASEKGLFKSVTVNADQPANLSVLAVIIKNTLDVDMLQQVSYGDKAEYSAKRGQTLLSQMMKIEKVKGIITANSISSLSGDSNLSDEMVEFDSKYLYNIGMTDTNLFLGYKMVAYAKELKTSDTEKTILYSYVEATDELTVKADDIIELNANNYQVKYYSTNDRETVAQTLTLSKELSVIYNGSCYRSNIFTENITDGTPPMLKPQYGKILFLDNNRDGLYDVAIVSEQKTFMIASTNLDEYTIYDKYSNSYAVLDETVNSPKVTIVSEGEKLSFADIAQGDIVEVYADKNNKRINAIVSKQKVSGKPTELIETDKIKIGDEIYTISKSYVNALDASPRNNNVVSILLNKQTTFYLNAEGEIAGVDLVGSLVDNYGYMVKLAKAGSSVDNKVQTKIFKSDGKFEIFEFATKVNKNGVMIKRENLTDSAYGLYNTATDSCIKQLVVYKLNSQNLINYLDTAIDYSTKTDYEKQQLTSTETFRKNITVQSRTYNSGDNAFANSSNQMSDLFLDLSVKVFNVPPLNSDSATFDNEDNFEVGNLSKFDDGKGYTIEAFDSSETNVPKVILNYIDSTTSLAIDLGTTLKVIKSVSQVYDAKENLIYKITAYDDGKLVEFYTISTIKMINNLKFGDVVQWVTNTKKEITAIQRYIDASTITHDDKTVIGNWQDALKIIQGHVISRDGDYIKILNGASTSVFRFTGAKAYVVDLTNKKFNSMNKTSIDKDEFIVARLNDASGREVYIYNFK